MLSVPKDKVSKFFSSLICKNMIGKKKPSWHLKNIRELNLCFINEVPWKKVDQRNEITIQF